MTDSKPHSISDTEALFVLVREFIDGSEMVRDYGEAQSSLDAIESEIQRLEEQYQSAHDALVKIAEGPSDVSPPEIARCALGWPSHGWTSGVYEQLETQGRDLERAIEIAFRLLDICRPEDLSDVRGPEGQLEGDYIRSAIAAEIGGLRKASSPASGLGTSGNRPALPDYRPGPETSNQESRGE